jgi:hypothetical protein
MVANVAVASNNMNASQATSDPAPKARSRAPNHEPTSRSGSDMTVTRRSFKIASAPLPWPSPPTLSQTTTTRRSSPGCSWRMCSETHRAPLKHVLQVGDNKSTNRRCPTPASNRLAKVATAPDGGPLSPVASPGEHAPATHSSNTTRHVIRRTRPDNTEHTLRSAPSRQLNGSATSSVNPDLLARTMRDRPIARSVPTSIPQHSTETRREDLVGPGGDLHAVRTQVGATG